MATCYPLGMLLERELVEAAVQALPAVAEFGRIVKVSLVWQWRACHVETRVHQGSWSLQTLAPTRTSSSLSVASK